MTNDGRTKGVGSRIRSAWLTIIKHSLNHLTLRVARSKRGPWTVMRHVGRTSGRVYETPIIVANSPQGFVAELTYGPQVSWYRNIVAAGHCTIVHHGESFEVDHIAPLPTAAGLEAFGAPRSWILRLLRRKEFRTLHVEGYPAVR